MSEITAPNSEISYDNGSESAGLFPIREVSRMTGINPVTLRAWERRYGLIQPIRTESGHRLYSRADIETVNRILDWVDRGVAVSKIAKILARDDQQASVVRAEHGAAQAEAWSQWRTRLMQAVSAFDDRQLEHLYGQVLENFARDTAYQDILIPLWHDLLRHQSRFGQASEWLFFDNFLRARTSRCLQLACASPAPRVLLAAITGECRELEVLVAGVLMGSDELSVKVLGVGQPFDELTLVCEKTRPRALVLFSNRSPTRQLPLRLQRLALTLDCPLLLAGEASELAQQSLAGSSIGCLGNDGRLMQRRLQQFLDGKLDT